MGAAVRGPAYGESTLADLLPGIGRALEGDGPSWLPQAAAYVVFLIDGLGAQQLQENRQHAPFLSSLSAVPFSATVPSTTATSLTSLGTGLPPGQHGMLGFTCRNPETGRLVNALFWDYSVDPLAWQPLPTMFERLPQVRVVTKREFEGSGLTLSALRGGTYVGADTPEERLSAVRACQPGSVTYVYLSDVDHTGHRHGVDSPRWRAALRAADAEAEDMAESVPSYARLVVTADHGMVDSIGEDRLDVDAVPGLREGVSLLGGEARFRHVYADDPAAVAARWADVLGERAQVLLRADAVAAGLFGPAGHGGSHRVEDRIGDVVVACTGTTALFSSRDFSYEMKLRGVHGSLTPAEMQIPLLVV